MKKLMLYLVLSVFLINLVFAQPIQGSNQGVLLDNIEIGTLTQDEINGLSLMREEEKLARDVYSTLYQENNLPIFNNIANSEQTHMGAVLVLMERYNLEDSATTEQGVFNNANLQELYNSLVTKGKESLLDALIVGATIEDLDINDLNKLMASTDKEDLKLVYENLVRGSRNHLRSFVSQIEIRGGTYEAQYISEAELEGILAGSTETGSLLDANSNIVPSFNSRLRANQMTGQRVMAGTYQESTGRQIQVQAMNNQMQLMVGGSMARIDLNLVTGSVGGQNLFRANLSNGRNAEIRIMPDVASQVALQRLRLQSCSELNNCSIELREVIQGDRIQVAYDLRTQRNSRVFGIFPARMNVQAQVNAETGEIMNVNKPWWAFVATESVE